MSDKIEKLEQYCHEIIDRNFDMVFAEDPDLKKIVIIGELKVLTEKKFDSINLATIKTTMADVRIELKERLFNYLFADLINEVRSHKD